MSVNVQTAEGLLRIAGNGGGGEGTVDDALSETSENAVQNKLITAKLNELDSLIEQTRQLKATLEQYGMVKLSDSSAVTDSTGLALPATEKNASIPGSLANQIAGLVQSDHYCYAVSNSTTGRSPGWIRVFSTQKGSECGVSLIGIGKTYSSSRSQSCLLATSFNWMNTKFKNILGNTADITKIREVHANAGGNYIDIFYKTANINGIFLTMLNMAHRHDAGRWKAIEPYTVPEDVGEGYTIIGSLDIVTTD